MINWINLTRIEQLEDIRIHSGTKPQLIFKHSTRCNVSSVAKNRLEKSATIPAVDFYYLDLIAHRNLSKLVADSFDVWHESPQVLLISQGECIYDESHFSIEMDEIIAEAGKVVDNTKG